MKRLKLNNEEKTRVLANKAREALLESVQRDWDHAEQAADAAAKLELIAINRLRNCGLKLCEAAGREQIGFEFYRMHSDSLPKRMSFQALKFCVHLCRNFAEPIQTIDEARSARQMLFEAFGHSETPKRIAEQSAHESNPWNTFVSLSSSFTGLFGKLETDDMARWSEDKLSTFIRQTEPIAQAYAVAKSIRAFGSEPL